VAQGLARVQIPALQKKKEKQKSLNSQDKEGMVGSSVLGHIPLSLLL
jgi:hypothetical protein